MGSEHYLGGFELEGNGGCSEPGSADGTGPASSGRRAGAVVRSSQLPQVRRKPSVKALAPPLPQPENHPPVLPVRQGWSVAAQPAVSSPTKTATIGLTRASWPDSGRLGFEPAWRKPASYSRIQDSARGTSAGGAPRPSGPAPISSAEEGARRSRASIAVRR
jgi:hypothetical protein